MSARRSLLVGAGAALVAQSVLRRVLLARLRRDVEQLNAGDFRPLLASFADDAVLHFNDGPHRWSGEHRGRAAIERFLRSFTDAGINGEIVDLWTAGPPWAMTLICRFDDWADTPSGERLYENRTVLVARTRWGKIVEQRDYYEDTGRIVDFDSALQAQAVSDARSG